MNTVCASAYCIFFNFFLQYLIIFKVQFFLFFFSFNFLWFRSFTSLVRCIPKHVILFEAIVNGIFKKSPFLSVCYWNIKMPADFQILILYPATLLNSFISPSSFLVDLWDSVCTVSSHPQTKAVLLLPFQSGCLLFLLPV